MKPALWKNRNRLWLTGVWLLTASLSPAALAFKQEPAFSSRFLWSYGGLMLVLVMIAAGLWFYRQRQIQRLRQATGEHQILECLDSRRLDSTTSCWLVKAGHNTVLVTSNGKHLTTDILPTPQDTAEEKPGQTDHEKDDHKNEGSLHAR